MFTDDSFRQIDHPLIQVFQLAAVVFMFALFFRMHRMPQPQPAMIGLLGLVLLINLAARVTHHPLFFATDIGFMGMLLASTMTTYYSIGKRLAAERLVKPAPPADAWDRYELGAVWLAGILAMSFVVYAYVDKYMDNFSLQQALTRAQKQGYVQAVAEQKEREKQAAVASRAKATRDSIELRRVEALAEQTRRDAAESRANSVANGQKLNVLLREKTRPAGVYISPLPHRTTPVPTTGGIRVVPPPAPAPERGRRKRHAYQPDPADADTSVYARSND